MTRLGRWLLPAFLVFFLGCFLIWPVWQILQGGFFDADGRFTLSFVGEVFANPIYLEGLMNSFGLAVTATTMAFLIALPLAVLSDRFDFPFKKLLSAGILLPIMLPPFVGAIGIRTALCINGPVNKFLESVGLMDPAAPFDWLGRGQFWGVALMLALSLYPILYLNATAALANIDPAMEEAAQNLGCTGLKRFRRITLPLIRPGLFAGGTIVFIWAFTELGTPLIFDYSRLCSVQIFNGLKNLSDSMPFALVAVLLASSSTIYALGKGLFGRSSHAMMAKASHAGSAKRLTGWKAGAAVAFFGGVLLLALLPHLSVIMISVSSDWYDSFLPIGLTLQNYTEALGHQLTLPAIQNSLIYASSATFINVILGVGIAWICVRTKLPGRQLLDNLAMLPLAVPGLVMAFGYRVMCQEGRFFDFLNPDDSPVAILIIAYAVRRLPLVVRSASAGLQQTSVTYEEAAQNLGCTPLRTVWRITLPLIAANLLAGALLAFSQAMLEVSDSLILATRQEYYPITKAIYTLMEMLGSGRFMACALGVWAMTFLAVTIIGASLLLGKKMGAIFRV